jgi:hypothetical protein
MHTQNKHPRVNEEGVVPCESATMMPGPAAGARARPRGIRKRAPPPRCPPAHGHRDIKLVNLTSVINNIPATEKGRDRMRYNERYLFVGPGLDVDPFHGRVK